MNQGLLTMTQFHCVHLHHDLPKESCLGCDGPLATQKILAKIGHQLLRVFLCERILGIALIPGNLPYHSAIIVALHLEGNLLWTLPASIEANGRVASLIREIIRSTLPPVLHHLWTKAFLELIEIGLGDAHAPWRCGWILYWMVHCAYQETGRVIGGAEYKEGKGN